MAKIYATSNPEITEREVCNMRAVRRLASQGMVLLKRGSLLPLSGNTETLALFGNGVRFTIKGGTGSGDVNSRLVINVEQAAEEAGFGAVGKSWLNRLDALYAEQEAAYYDDIRARMKENFMMGLFHMLNQPFHAPNSVAITEEDLEDADVAIYVIARMSGEGKDRTLERGDYYLTEEEEENIHKLIEKYGKIIVVLNIGGVIDTKFLRETAGVDSVLLASQGGNITGYAIMDVLTGKVVPSGHLTMTWAENYSDYPGADEFSHINSNTDDEYYKEGIYVGYRYFDTFNITPAYPFGYGLSYTDFAVNATKTELCGTKVKVTVDVINTGSLYSGKEVVQVYGSAPSGALEKPYQVLTGYRKTKELAPGETETLTITFDFCQLASFDSARGAYVLEPGTYYVRTGTNSRASAVCAAVVLDQEVITEKVQNILPLDCEMKLLSSRGVQPYTYPMEAEEKEFAPVLHADPSAFTTITHTYTDVFPELVSSVTDHKITMDEVQNGTASLEELVAQLTPAELAAVCCGAARGGLGGDSFVGVASALVPGAAGDTTSLMIEDRNIRNLVLADGPAGLRLIPKFICGPDGNPLPGTGMDAMAGMDKVAPKKDQVIPEGSTTYYQYTTAIPIASLLAMSWDEEVLETAGSIVGEEMKEFGVQLWLAPGMNIMRNPLCGRNFEYYGEDPLIAGKCAAADTRGVQNHGGIGTTIKHFAVNNQEDNRMHINAHIEEQAAREIYLKGFEIAIKESQPLSMMTSYNLVNGTHTANRYDIITSCARQEWGFEGLVMTDWGTTGSMGSFEENKYGNSDSALCIKAGNDLIMPGSQFDVDTIVEGLNKGIITLGELQNCVLHVLNVVKNSSVY